MQTLTTRSREAIERRALEISAELDAKAGPYRAELSPDATPQWYVIKTVPGQEARAVHWLADRGLGVYLPQFERQRVLAGRKTIQRYAMFPRHIFAFIWDVMRHWRRISACPGVSCILTLDERPIIVPDAEINRMQMMEFIGQVKPAPKRSRRKRRYDPVEEAHTVTISCKSYWAGLLDLDEKARVSVLHKALGLGVAIKHG